MLNIPDVRVHSGLDGMFWLGKSLFDGNLTLFDLIFGIPKDDLLPVLMGPHLILLNILDICTFRDL